MGRQRPTKADHALTIILDRSSGAYHVAPARTHAYPASVTMAAMELDYSDHSQFTNAFLKASGVLPGDLRDK